MNYGKIRKIRSASNSINNLNGCKWKGSIKVNERTRENTYGFVESMKSVFINAEKGGSVDSALISNINIIHLN